MHAHMQACARAARAHTHTGTMPTGAGAKASAAVASAASASKRALPKRGAIGMRVAFVSTERARQGVPREEAARGAARHVPRPPERDGAPPGAGVQGGGGGAPGNAQPPRRGRGRGRAALPPGEGRTRRPAARRPRGRAASAHAPRSRAGAVPQTFPQSRAHLDALLYTHRHANSATESLQMDLVRSRGYACVCARACVCVCVCVCVCCRGSGRLCCCAQRAPWASCEARLTSRAHVRQQQAKATLKRLQAQGWVPTRTAASASAATGVRALQPRRTGAHMQARAHARTPLRVPQESACLRVDGGAVSFTAGVHARACVRDRWSCRRST